jgi:hypothetical protein
MNLRVRAVIRELEKRLAKVNRRIYVLRRRAGKAK